ncbi:MAG: hypothetical protein EPN88_15885 [Bacteroidetes bacterium]|nr:MAG: hypothetical protein EPN88_15885 [Bacteroidota bacterium]
MELMKKVGFSAISVILFLFSGLFLLNFSLSGQEASKTSPALPDNIKAIVNYSCMTCHSSTGGLLSRWRLNFTDWTRYSTTKQKDKAEMIYSVLKKAEMPPKSARETRPEIIPTKEQIEVIKKWVDSLKTELK